MNWTFFDVHYYRPSPLLQSIERAQLGLINKHLPKLPDELGEDVLQFGSEVPPHIVFDVPNSLHLNTESDICIKSGRNCPLQ